MSKDIWFLLNPSALLGARPLTLTDFPNGVNSPGVEGVVPQQVSRPARNLDGEGFCHLHWFALDQRADQE